MLRIDNLTFLHLPHGPGCVNVNLQCPSGTVTVLLGPNGCGKTTLLRCVMGTLKPQEGRIQISDTPLDGLSPRSRARKVAMVAQKNEIPFSFSVRETILMGRYAQGRMFRGPNDADEEIVDNLIERWDMGSVANRSVSVVSGGELQKTLLLRAMAQESPVILLDEPSNNLDPSNQKMLVEMVRAMARDGRTVCAVLHDVFLASVLGDRIALMNHGTIVAYGVPELVLTEQNLASVYRTPFMSAKGPQGQSMMLPQY